MVGPAEGGDVLFADQRIVQFLVLVIELDDGAGERCAFLDAKALGQRPGGPRLLRHA
jgi:hypothetical protein